ncbi:MAG: hypothetical protein HC925_06320 [Coleofasciculaceae cyanobacterium SM2_3_26]|nr:hypothetical protein [Coleofasciculaceae cyanobacterium SM2_3_26]
MRIARSIHDAWFSNILRWRWCWLLPIATTVMVVELGIASRRAIAQFSPCEPPQSR